MVCNAIERETISRVFRDDAELPLFAVGFRYYELLVNAGLDDERANVRAKEGVRGWLEKGLLWTGRDAWGPVICRDVTIR